MATRINTFFRLMATPVALKYGGGESGLARFLKDLAKRIAADPQAKFTEEERRFIDTILADAWQTQAGSGGRVAPSRGRAAPTPAGSLGWVDSLDGFGSLDRGEDLALPKITCLAGATIHSQAAQSYTQWVPLQDVDLAQTICPFGHSDRLDSRYRTSTMALWGEGKLHPAPLSRPAVERIARERIQLSRSN